VFFRILETSHSKTQCQVSENLENSVFNFLESFFLFIRVLFVIPLNAELNPICHLLALLRAHHILHVSRIRVKPYLCLTMNPLVCEALLQVTKYSALLCYFQGLKEVFDVLVIS